MKKIAKVVFVIIAALIGAGFSSGQEINAFFYIHGANGMLGLIICCILTSIIIYKTFKILKTENIDNYKEFVYTLVEKDKNKKYFNIGFIINTIVNLFLMVTFFIMIVAFGAYFSQELEINSYIGSLILAIACFITFLTNVNGVVKVSGYLIPFVIFCIVLIGILNINSIDIKTCIDKLNSINSHKWLLSSILYCSYNSILLIPMLIPLKKYVSKNKENILIAIISGVIIFILGIAIFWMLAKAEININKIEMPALYVVGYYYKGLRTMYACIILASIYTTAISIGISLLENVTKSKKSYIILAMFICITGFLLSGAGFSNLVTLIYPIFGYLGLIQISAIFIK